MSDGPETEILDAARERVNERADMHGKPELSFRSIARLWTSYILSPEVDPYDLDGEDVAYMMVLLKVGRSAHAPDWSDRESNDVDIAGYAECASRVRDRESDE